MSIRLAVWAVLATLTLAVWLLAAVGARALIVDEPACERGAISAIGPVDALGRGDTTPEVGCLP